MCAPLCSAGMGHTILARGEGGMRSPVLQREFAVQWLGWVVPVGAAYNLWVHLE